MFSGKSCNYLKLRTNLRLAINRLKLLEKKKTELALKARKEIADYISNGKDDRARIRVEHIVREDYMVEAMEIIEMFCDLLLARFGLVEKMKEMDPGLEEAIATILWSAPYLSADILEMKEIQKQLTNKYSKEYVEMCHRNGFENVNEQVMHKMSIAAPPKILIENYMVEIAKTYKVPFEPDLALLNDEPAAEAEDLIKLDSASGSIGFESYDNEMNERKKPPTPPGPGGSDFPGFGGGRGGGGGGGGGLPVLPPSAPQNPPLVPHNPQMPPGSVQVMPPLQDYNTVPPYEPPPGMLPPPVPAMPPNAGIAPSPHWPSEQPLPNYDELVPPPSQPSLPGASPSDASPGFGDDPTESIMNLPEVPGFPAVPSNPPGGASVGSEDIDFDDLTRRFQDLKKRK